jgi:hypothetical protein
MMTVAADVVATQRPAKEGSGPRFLEDGLSILVVDLRQFPPHETMVQGRLAWKVEC